MVICNILEVTFKTVFFLFFGRIFQKCLYSNKDILKLMFFISFSTSIHKQYLSTHRYFFEYRVELNETGSIISIFILKIYIVCIHENNWKSKIISQKKTNNHNFIYFWLRTICSHQGGLSLLTVMRYDQRKGKELIDWWFKHTMCYKWLLGLEKKIIKNLSNAVWFLLLAEAKSK